MIFWLSCVDIDARSPESRIMVQESHSRIESLVQCLSARDWRTSVLSTSEWFRRSRWINQAVDWPNANRQWHLVDRSAFGLDTLDMILSQLTVRVWTLLIVTLPFSEYKMSIGNVRIHPNVTRWGGVKHSLNRDRTTHRDGCRTLAS